MAVRIQGTTVIDDSKNFTNLNDFTATSNVVFSSTGSIRVPSGTTAERPASPSVGDIRFNTDESALEQYNGSEWSFFSAQDIIAGSLDKTFSLGELATINLSRSAGIAPAVSVTKEVPQEDITNNDWDVESNGDNYTLHDTAYGTTLTPSDATGNGTFTLGSGSFAAEDVGKRIVGNGGEAVLTATDGSYELQSNFNNTTTIASGDWSLFALDIELNLLGLTLSGTTSVFPTSQHTTAITTTSIDTEFWADINSMTADDSANDGSVYYAVSTDDRTTWSIIDDTDGERNIVRNNGGTWEYNFDTTYASESWVAATENNEFYAIEEATSVATNQMDATQLNAVSDANHYTLGNDLDLAITLFMADGGSTSPTSDGVAIDYDANARNESALPGVDYTYDVLDSTSVLFEALSAENFKIRIT